jgi:diguanylate cyclase (GGDEF)-like protein/PAS domain S-box-containing protein
MGRTQSRPDDPKILRFDQGGALLRKVIESAAVGMALVGVDGRLLFVNTAFAEMIGCTIDDAAGTQTADLVHPDCDAALPLHLDRLLAGEAEEHRAESRLRHADGSAIWVLAVASLLRSDTTGHPLYVILQTTNIDRQKRAEAALAYAESRWSFALEAAGQGVWDHDKRTDDMFYSRTWRTMRGYRPDEWVDPNQEAWLSRVHPDDVPRIRANVDKQDHGVDGYETLEYRERHRDGHWVWILSRGRPVEWDENGVSVRTIGTDTDITRLKTIEAELAEEKERLRVTLQSIGDGVISTDSNRRVTFMNTVAERMTGWTLAGATGHLVDEVFPMAEERSGRIAASPVARCLVTGDVTYVDEDVVLEPRRGERRDIRCSAAPLRTPEGTVIGAVLVFQDVSSSRTLQRQLAHSASHDSLTGLPNRVAFEQALGTITAEAVRDRREHALCFIDLDHFKPVNDGAGHAAGDALLREVAATISSCCRKQDFAARIGGDEFALLLSDCPLEVARRVAEKIGAAIAAIEFRAGATAYRISASVGITSVTDTSPAELMRRADAACYTAKGEGRSRVVVYTD